MNMKMLFTCILMMALASGYGQQLILSEQPAGGDSIWFGMSAAKFTKQYKTDTTELDLAMVRCKILGGASIKLGQCALSDAELEFGLGKLVNVQASADSFDCPVKELTQQLGKPNNPDDSKLFAWSNNKTWSVVLNANPENNKIRVSITYSPLNNTFQEHHFKILHGEEKLSDYEK